MLFTIATYFSTVQGYTILLIILAIYLLHYCQQNRRITKLGNLIPGERPLPFIGNILDFATLNNDDLAKELMIRGLKYLNNDCRVVRAWMGTRLIVFIAAPEDAEIFLNSTEHIDKSAEYSFFKPWLGNGLLISTGKKWKEHRQLIAPAFHQNVLKTFLKSFNSNSLAVVENMLKECETNKEFDIHHYMNSVTVDILMETAMGTKKIYEESSKYGQAVLDLCDLLQYRQFKVLLRPDFIFNLTKYKVIQDKLLSTVHGLSRKIFKIKNHEFMKNAKQGKFPRPSLAEIINKSDEHINLTDSNIKGLHDDLDDQDKMDVCQKRRLAFLDLMIETAYYNKNKISEQEIKDQVDTIMFEGHDTVSAGSSFVFCLLGLYQNVQEKAYNEIYTIFGNSNRPATLTDTTEMKYLERVILETLRLYPPVPAIARKINKDVQIVSNNYIIPANTTVVIVQFGLHRDKRYFPEPEKFDPDRHLPENSTNRHFYSFVPFSAGPRSCIGRKYAMLKMKILISTILRKYKFYSTIPEEKFRLRGDIILKRSDGFMVSIEKRNKN